jgi:hypothetical protein
MFNIDKMSHTDRMDMDRVVVLQNNIQELFNNRAYKLLSDITTITNKNTKINYICLCEKEKHKSYRCILINECRHCNSIKLKTLPTEINHPIDDPEEKWMPTTGGFVSDKGRACNINGKILKPDEKGRCYLGGKLQYMSILLAKAFNISGSGKLQKKGENNIIVRVYDKDNINLQNIGIGTKNEIGIINGKKSKQSDRFKTTQHKNLEDYKDQEYRIIPEIPHHKIYQSGDIWSDTCNRFLTGSKTNGYRDKKYLGICFGEKTYKIHRLVCYAFHPIEDHNCYTDYSKLQVNHKDGNTLNNHRDNLEWVTANQNMRHAYDTGLNKKTRPVIQYSIQSNDSPGEIIAEFRSIAEASRKSSIPEHTIRDNAKSKTQAKQFIWRYKFPEDNEIWSKKYSSKI